MPPPVVLGALSGAIAGAGKTIFLKKVLLGAAAGFVQHKLATKGKGFESPDPVYQFSALSNNTIVGAPIPVGYGTTKVAGYNINQSPDGPVVDRFLLLSEGEVQGIRTDLTKINDILFTPENFPGSSYATYPGSPTQILDGRSKGRDVFLDTQRLDQYSRGLYGPLDTTPDVDPYVNQVLTKVANLDEDGSLIIQVGVAGIARFLPSIFNSQPLRAAVNVRYRVHYKPSASGNWSVAVDNTVNVAVPPRGEEGFNNQGNQLAINSYQYPLNQPASVGGLGGVQDLVLDHEISGLSPGSWDLWLEFVSVTAPPNPYENSAIYQTVYGQVNGTDLAQIAARVQFVSLRKRELDVVGLRNVAYIAATLNSSEKLNGNPTITTVGHWLKIETWDSVGSSWLTTKYWSNNPAACIRDLLLNKRYGVGLDPSEVDDQSFADFAEYCDELVPTPDGFFMEKRYELDIMLTQSKSWSEHLGDMLDTCLAFLYYSEGKYKIAAFRDAATSASYGPDDLLKGSLQIDQIGLSDWPNRIVIRYPDRDQDWTLQTVFSEVQSEQLRRGRVDDVLLTILGCTRRTQALRIAKFTELHAQYAPTIIQGIFNYRGTLHEPGDIIEYTDPVRGWTNKKFFILETEEAIDGTFSFVAREHISSIYQTVHYGQIEDSRTDGSTLPSPLSPPKTPSGLSVEEYRIQNEAGQTSLGMVVTWGPPVKDPETDLASVLAFLDHYSVRLSDDGGVTYREVAREKETGKPQYRHYLTDLPEGQYSIRIVPVTTRGVEGDPLEGLDFKLYGASIHPGGPLNVEGYRTREYTKLSWDNPPDVRDIAGYEIRSNEDTSSSTTLDPDELQAAWDSGEVIVTKLQGTEINFEDYNSSEKMYIIRSIDSFGNYSVLVNAGVNDEDELPLGQIPGSGVIRLRSNTIHGRQPFPFKFRDGGFLALFDRSMRTTQGANPEDDGGDTVQLHASFGRHGGGLAICTAGENLVPSPAPSNVVGTLSNSPDYAYFRTSRSGYRVDGVSLTTISFEMGYELSASANPHTVHLPIRPRAGVETLTIEFIEGAGGSAVASETITLANRDFKLHDWTWLAVTATPASGGAALRIIATGKSDLAVEFDASQVEERDYPTSIIPTDPSTGTAVRASTSHLSYDPELVGIRDGMISIDWWLFSTKSIGTDRDLFKWSDNSGGYVRLYIVDESLLAEWKTASGTYQVSHDLSGVINPTGIIGTGFGVQPFGVSSFGGLRKTTGANFGTDVHQVQVTWEGPERTGTDAWRMRLYYDGAEIGAAQAPDSPVEAEITENKIYLGGADGSGHLLDGLIDNVLAVPYTPDPAEVQAYFHTDLPFRDVAQKLIVGTDENLEIVDRNRVVGAFGIEGATLITKIDFPVWRTTTPSGSNPGTDRVAVRETRQEYDASPALRTVNADVLENEQTITHNLGYTPRVRVFIGGTSGGQLGKELGVDDPWSLTFQATTPWTLQAAFYATFALKSNGDTTTTLRLLRYYYSTGLLIGPASIYVVFYKNDSVEES